MGSKPLVAVEAKRVSDTLEEAAKEPRKLKDHVIMGLEQLLEWMNKQTKPNYKALMADLKEVQELAKRIKAKCVVILKPVTELRAQKKPSDRRNIFMSQK